MICLGTTLTAEELKDDSLVKIDGQDWKARIRPDHLELVRVECTDDGDEKSKEKRTNIKHEIEMRKQEMNALKQQRAALMEECEDDPDLDENNYDEETGEWVGGESWSVVKVKNCVLHQYSAEMI